MEDQSATDGPGRRPTYPALAAVGATVAAVVAVMTVPHWFSAQGRGGPSVPRPPTPSHAPEAPGTRTWQPVTCPPGADRVCAAPLSLDHAGLLLTRAGGRRLVWHHDSSAAPEVTFVLPRSSSNRWVLVGIERPGGDSRPSVELGTASPVMVPTDRLSLFSVRGHGAVVVRVSDVGSPRDDEVLHVAEYRSR